MRGVNMQWLTDHPEFLSVPAYIAGDSYAGIIIPAIVQKISNGKTKGTYYIDKKNFDVIKYLRTCSLAK